MDFLVYIIQSDSDGSYYKGYSLNPQARLLQHNNGESTYTKNKMPWRLVYVERCETKREALIREKALKKYSRQQIDTLIKNQKNIWTGSSVGPNL